MLLALPALLGAGLIVVVLARPRWVSRHPGAVKGAIGVAGGNVPGLGRTLWSLGLDEGAAPVVQRGGGQRDLRPLR